MKPGIRNSWVSRLIVGAAMLLAACESPTVPHGAGVAEVPVRITAVTVGTPIQTLVVQVTAQDLPAALVFNLTVVNGVASGTIKIPPGPARTITVTAVDDQGNPTHDGSATIDVRPGQNTPLQIKLKPRAGQVPISVTFGNFGVVVTPAVATIDLAVAKSLPLSVTVTDVNGQPTNAQVAWATSQPAVATVDASGLVTGLIDGNATIVATYEGVAGLSAITVTSSGGSTAEICDGIDNNHNGQVDEGLTYCSAGNGIWSLTPALTTNCTVLIAHPSAGKVTTTVFPSGVMSLQFDFGLGPITLTVPVGLDMVTGSFSSSGSPSGSLSADGSVTGAFDGLNAFTMTVGLKNIVIQQNGVTVGSCQDVNQTVSGTRLAS